MYPVNGVQRKIFPLCSGFIVTKFEPDSKYREIESIENESGDYSQKVGIDLMSEFDIEMVLHPNSNIPAPLTVLSFTNVASWVPFSNSGALSVLIDGDIKVAGQAGRALKISFKGMTNINLP